MVEPHEAHRWWGFRNLASGLMVFAAEGLVLVVLALVAWIVAVVILALS
jgi:hypothetical protein